VGGPKEYNAALPFESCSSLEDGMNLLSTHSASLYHLLRQNCIPVVVLRKPIKTKNGTQTVAMVIPNEPKSCSVDIFVMPYTEVTNVKGRKNIETYNCVSTSSFPIMLVGCLPW
jgi:hypothetical protein